MSKAFMNSPQGLMGNRKNSTVTSQIQHIIKVQTKLMSYSNLPLPKLVKVPIMSALTQLGYPFLCCHTGFSFIQSPGE